MNNYSEYKLADELKRQAKQANCIHCLKIRVTLHCLGCGKINTECFTEEELKDYGKVSGILYKGACLQGSVG